MDEAPSTRASLLVRLRDPRDERAWSEFVEIYTPLVYRLARRRGLQDADAIDLSQEVFRAVASAIGRFDVDPARGSFRAWLSRIARNLTINALAARDRQVRGTGDTAVGRLLDELPAESDAPSAEFDLEYRRRLFDWAAERVRAELPEHLLADEHHQPRDGAKNDVATTVAEGCCPGAALAPTAGTEDLQAAYGAFASEARDIRPDYRPRTVSVDGWAPTHQAWRALFPLAVQLRCFPHGWLDIRSRGKLSESFAELSRRAWESYRAPSRRSFAQRLRRLREWARRQGMSTWPLEQVEKLCGRSSEYAEAYSHPGGHRTSNMLDRVMRSMNRDFDDGQHLHGGAEACDRHCRAWALLYNFRPWNPATTRANGGWRSPAERLDEHRDHDDWLQNLMISASLGGFRR